MNFDRGEKTSRELEANDHSTKPDAPTCKHSSNARDDARDDGLR
jgi:hypothetical protein